MCLTLFVAISYIVITYYEIKLLSKIISLYTMSSMYPKLHHLKNSCKLHLKIPKSKCFLVKANLYIVHHYFLLHIFDLRVIPNYKSMFAIPTKFEIKGSLRGLWSLPIFWYSLYVYIYLLVISLILHYDPF